MPSLGRALPSAGVLCLARLIASTTTPFSFGLLALSLVAASFAAQNAAPAGPNADPTYQALRNLTLGGEAVSVSNLDLKHDAGTFHLRSGTVCFTTPVQGKVTGAVFMGDGNFVISPRSEEHTSELQSPCNLVCRLL